MARPQIPEPPLARFLFADTRTAPLWFLLRLYLGWAWLSAGLGKVGRPGWTGDQAGGAIRGFVQGALQKTAGEHPDVSPLYARFLENVVLPHANWFSYLVVAGELAVGAGLLLGLFTGIAAFCGGLLNANFLLAGAVSSNPILFIVATWIVLAWRVAGWWGLDRWLLPYLGTPWQPGTAFRKPPS